MNIISLGAGVQSSTMALMAAHGEITPISGTKYQKHSPPAFTSEHGKPTGLLMRQCTVDFKLAPLHRAYRKLGGKKIGVTQWIGISFDEAHRMKPAREPWLTSIWPLVERRMTRQHCLEWMKRKRYPTPPRSACVFCPYHNNAEWRRLRDDEPDEFARAAKWEKDLQATFAQVAGFRGEVFLHRDLALITDVDLDTESPQMDMFGDECEGMCGV